VLEGEIVVHVDGDEHKVGPGGFALAPRGVPHAFLVTSEGARVLCLQTPGTGQALFRHASDPTSDDAIDGPVDFARVHAAAQQHGGVEILGPPPFSTTS
jgi:quercetin dioxygenase-like cupin family protein